MIGQIAALAEALQGINHGIDRGADPLARPSIAATAAPQAPWCADG